MSEQGSEKERFPWAGPALFLATLAALFAFFSWFL